MAGIVVDVDGVLLDYVGAVRRELSLPAAWRPVFYDLRNDPTIVAHCGRVRAATLYDWLAVSHDDIRWLPCARGSLSYISTHPAHTVTVATKLTAQPSGWAEGRARFLADVSHRYVVQTAMVRHKSQLRGTILIDDNPDEAVSWVRSDDDRIAYLINAGYNQDAPPHPRIIRVANLQEAVRHICKR